MSQTFSLVCHAAKEYVWIGQGPNLGRKPMMDALYTEEPATMAALVSFLNRHRGKPLEFICDDLRELEMEDYAEAGR